MRLLVVGHSYTTAFGQSKYVAMKRLQPSVTLKIVTPPSIGHLSRVFKQERALGIDSEDIVSIKRLLGKTNATYVLEPGALYAVIKGFRPDHIHIEEDPHSFVGMEAVLLARLAAPHSKLSFFIWDNLYRMPRFPASAAKRFVTQSVLSNASLVVCGNREAQGLLAKKKYFGESVVLPQVGLDPADYPMATSCERRSSRRNEPVVGYMGRLVPEKGILLLIEALSQLRDLPWTVLIVGSGVLRSQLEETARTALAGRMIVRDAVPLALVAEAIRELDIFVLPSYGTSRWKEQFGLTLAQAMMSGLACVGSSSGAIPEVLGPGGIVVREDSVQELRKALELLIVSFAERQRLGAVAREYAISHYTNEVVAGGYLQAFERVQSLDEPDLEGGEIPFGLSSSKKRVSS